MILPRPAPATGPRSLDDPSLYFNRELSWLEFNDRVLEEALDEQTPLLERLKFISIFGTNLDEFFMIRVAAIKQQIDAQIHRRSDDGRSAEEQLSAISQRLRVSLKRQMRVLNETILPELETHGVRILRVDEIDGEARAHVDRIFDELIFPVLTPLAVDAGHPFPYISNLSLSLAVELEELGPEGVRMHFARVKIPPKLPRFLRVEPAEEGAANFVALEDVIAHNLASLFPGMQVMQSYLFRVTRDGDLDLQEDEADDLLEAIESELQRRRFGEPVRLEMERGMPAEMRALLLEALNLSEVDAYEVDGYMALGDLMSIATLPGFPQLRDRPFTAAVPKRLVGVTDLFAAISEGDILLHHPYESFDPVLQFLQEAAEDEAVLAIKTTLYRTSGKNSPFVRALLDAAENGKQVAVLIELKARFDEENNIEWARRLERAGVHVVYGFPGLKVHSKLTMAVRQESSGIRRYMHFGTGNYNENTARIYTDFSLFTAREDIAEDVAQLFNALTGFSKMTDYDELLVAPINLRRDLLAKIERESEHARAGRPSGIRAQLNALADAEVIRALYRASQAGVSIDLLVRGICTLRPGVPGVSENIRVRSIVGRFLEHARAYVFENGGKREVYIGSADWMGRNLDRRVELMVPVLDANCANAVNGRILGVLFADNVKSRALVSDGTYARPRLAGGPPIQAQVVFLAQAQAP